MTIIKSVKLKFAYDDATSRIYTFNGVTSQQASGIKAKVKALNASLAGGTADAFANTFVSDNHSPCKMISEAKIITTVQESIYPV